MQAGKDLDCVALKTAAASATKEKIATRTERWVPAAQRNQMKEECPTNGAHNEACCYKCLFLGIALHHLTNIHCFHHPPLKKKEGMELPQEEPLGGY